ncbi:MAG: thermonuclease family protein [Nitrospiria bacterium]
MAHPWNFISPFLTRSLLSFAFVTTFVFHFYNISTAQDLFKATVIKAIDGDTIRLSDGRTVRYLGINAPELRKKLDNLWIYDPEPYAEAAAQLNQQLVEGKEVLIEFDPVVGQTDGFGRLLAYVYIIDDKRLANEEILKAGLAKTDTPSLLMKHRIRFWSIEERAWTEKRGLWADAENAP